MAGLAAGLGHSGDMVPVRVVKPRLAGLLFALSLLAAGLRARGDLAEIV